MFAIDHVNQVLSLLATGNRQPTLYAPLRRRANDPTHFVQECHLLAVRTDRAARRGARPFPRCRRRDRRFPGAPCPAFFLATLLVDSDMADGAVPYLRHDT